MPLTISRGLCSRMCTPVSGESRSLNLHCNKSNETLNWCDTVQVLFLQSHSTCFGRKRPSTGVFKTSTAATGTRVIVASQSSHHLIRAVPALIRRCDDIPATTTHVPVAAVLVLNTPVDGRLRPKHVEWLCRNKTCTVLHQVGVSFDLEVMVFTTTFFINMIMLYYLFLESNIGYQGGNEFWSLHLYLAPTLKSYIRRSNKIKVWYIWNLVWIVVVNGQLIIV